MILIVYGILSINTTCCLSLSLWLFLSFLIAMFGNVTCSSNCSCFFSDFSCLKFFWIIFDNIVLIFFFLLDFFKSSYIIVILCYLFSKIFLAVLGTQIKSELANMDLGDFSSAMSLYIVLGLILIGIVQFLISAITTRWRSANQVKGFAGPDAHWLKGNVNDVSSVYQWFPF